MKDLTLNETAQISGGMSPWVGVASGAAGGGFAIAAVATIATGGGFAVFIPTFFLTSGGLAVGMGSEMGLFEAGKATVEAIQEASNKSA